MNVVNNQSANFFTVMLLIRSSQQNICSEEFPVSLGHYPLVQFSYLPQHELLWHDYSELLPSVTDQNEEGILAPSYVAGGFSSRDWPVHWRKSASSLAMTWKSCSSLEIFVNMDQTSAVPIGRCKLRRHSRGNSTLHLPNQLQNDVYISSER